MGWREALQVLSDSRVRAIQTTSGGIRISLVRNARMLGALPILGGKNFFFFFFFLAARRCVRSAEFSC